MNCPFEKGNPSVELGELTPFAGEICQLEAAAPAPRLCRCQRHAPGSRSARRWSFGQNRGASPRRAGEAARELKMGRSGGWD